MWCDQSNFPRFPFTKSHGKVNCRTSTSAKRKFKEKLRKLTSRKRPGTFREIITAINQTTVGWINYYGISNMKKFIVEIEQWLNRRLRQLLWKRWKLVRTKYKMLRKYGINHEDAMRLANTRKGYWRASLNQIIHRAITKEKLIKWGLKDLFTLYELRYLKG